MIFTSCFIDVLFCSRIPVGILALCGCCLTLVSCCLQLLLSLSLSSMTLTSPMGITLLLCWTSLSAARLTSCYVWTEGSASKKSMIEMAQLPSCLGAHDVASCHGAHDVECILSLGSWRWVYHWSCWPYHLVKVLSAIFCYKITTLPPGANKYFRYFESTQISCLLCLCSLILLSIKGKFISVCNVQIF